MTPTKKKRLSKDRPNPKSLVTQFYELADDVVLAGLEPVPEICSTCYAHRDYPEGMSDAATNTRCFLYPTAMQVVKNHWCTQWKQIKEKTDGLP